MWTYPKTNPQKDIMTFRVAEPLKVLESCPGFLVTTTRTDDFKQTLDCYSRVKGGTSEQYFILNFFCVITSTISSFRDPLIVLIALVDNLSELL